MKRLSIILSMLMLIAFTFGACTQYSPEPNEEEISVIKNHFGTAGPSIHILFNRHEAAAYLLGLSEGSGYVIIKRSNLSVCEAGEKNPYESYMDLKKYYREIFSYVVYDPSITETPFYDLLHDSYGNTYSEATKLK